MALGRFVSDLEVGDVFRPMTYTMTPFIVREYAHGVDELAEEFHRPTKEAGQQLVPPTLVHIDKIRLIQQNCPGGPGPHARIHYQFHSTQHDLIPVGAELTSSGRVARRYERKGRIYLDLEIELREHATGRLLVSYEDTAILNFAPGAEPLDVARSSA
jgi:hypothetical protein